MNHQKNIIVLCLLFVKVAHASASDCDYLLDSFCYNQAQLVDECLTFLKKEYPLKENNLLYFYSTRQSKINQLHAKNPHIPMQTIINAYDTATNIFVPEYCNKTPRISCKK